VLHIGALWQLRDGNGLPSETPWNNGVAYTKGQRRVSEGHVYEALNAATSGNKPPVHLDGIASDGAVNWAFINDGTGYILITGFTSARVVTGIVQSHLPANLATKLTRYWSEGAWSASEGYPRAVTFSQQRLAFAGTDGSPATVWESRSETPQDSKRALRTMPP
jgi:hypothetical protein